MSLRVGPHVNRIHAKGTRPVMSAHVAAARKDAENEGVDVRAVSFFVSNPRARKIVMQEKEAASMKKYLTETKVTAIVHASYSSVPWKGDPNAADFIRQELKMCDKAGAAGLVVHLPVAPPDGVLKYLPRLYTKESKHVRLYLEPVASSPSKSHYITAENFSNLFKRISKIDPKLAFTGLCIDTAHLWSSGVDISSYEDADAWLLDLEAIAHVLPMDKIALHLNDSAYNLGDGRDHHASLMKGHIWEKFADTPNESGLKAFIDFAKKHDIPVILERHNEDELRSDYRVLHTICGDSDVAVSRYGSAVTDGDTIVP